MPTIDPQLARNDPDAALGQITRAQFADFERVFKPTEDRLFANTSLETVEADADRAGGLAGKAFDLRKNGLESELVGRNIRLTDRQRQILDRRSTLDRARAVASAENIRQTCLLSIRPQTQMHSRLCCAVTRG